MLDAIVVLAKILATALLSIFVDGVSLIGDLGGARSRSSRRSAPVHRIAELDSSGVWGSTRP